MHQGQQKTGCHRFAAFLFTHPHPCDNNKLTYVCTVLLLSLFFVQDLLKLSNSFEDDRICINCQDIGSYERKNIQ